MLPQPWHLRYNAGAEWLFIRSIRKAESMTTTGQKAARRVTYQLETLWDYDYEPTHEELSTLYETAKKNQWNGSTTIDWSRQVGAEGPVLNVKLAFAGTNFFSRLTEEQQREIEIKVSAWRLSQFLHGEQGALVVCELATVSFQILSPSQPISFHTVLIDWNPVRSSRAYMRSQALNVKSSR